MTLPRVPIHLLPEEVLSDDPGDDVLRRFRYQAGIAAMLMCRMFFPDGRVVAVFAEHHEDVLLLLASGKYEAVQVKTRLDGTPFKANEDVIIHVIAKFICHEEMFPDTFERFSIASNCGFFTERETGSNLHHLIELAAGCANGDGPTGRLSTFISRIEKAANKGRKRGIAKCSRATILSVLKRLNLLDSLPHFHDIDGRIGEALRTECKFGFNSLRELDGAVRGLVDEVMHASARSADLRDAFYLSLVDDKDEERVKLVVGEKRFDKTRVTAVVEKSIQPALAMREPLTVDELPKDADPMRVKMAKGLISPESIDLAEDHRYSAEKFLLAEAYRRNDGQETDVLYERLQAVVKTECVEAQDAVRVADAAYGQQMLEEVRTRLRQTAGTTRVQGVEYEVLMGVASQLTNACKVWWSERFELPGASA